MKIVHRFIRNPIVIRTPVKRRKRLEIEGVVEVMRRGRLRWFGRIK